MSKHNVPLDRLVDLVNEAVDEKRVELGRLRQEKVWMGETPDYLPLLLGHTERFFGGLKDDRTWKMAEHELRGGAVCKEMWEFPHYSFEEQYYDPAKMLYEALWEILSWARSYSDAQLSVRPYYLMTVESALGVELGISEEAHVFVTKTLSKEDVYNISADGIYNKGLFPRVRECIEFMKEHLPRSVHLFPGDTSSPLSMAEGLRGNEIWYDFNDCPDDVRKLLHKCADLCISSAYWYKELIGGLRHQTYHGSLFQARGGVRVAEDSIVLISPEKYREFVFNEDRRIFREFDGGWFHSCGKYESQLEYLLAMPEVTAINFGNPEQWPNFEDSVRRIIAAGKIYYGAWPRKPNEPIEEYLRRAIRVAGPERKGMIIFLQGDGPFPDPRETMCLWHKIQDEELGR
ncbi:MAG: hypothetical protein HY350_01895 [Candidatus Omnitrophica bacterium]|nr:hypothetical protein [Candidatus Omnitrophota bacterium]